MRFKRTHTFKSAIAVAVLLLAMEAAGQVNSGILRGKVVDPSGAVVPKIAVIVEDSNGHVFTAETNQAGMYEVKGLTPGTYALQVNLTGFATYEERGIQIVSAQVSEVDVKLAIAEQKEKVKVTGAGSNLSLNPAANVGAVILRGPALEALSDDPDELLYDLRALAGPSAGPAGGQIYIDGFTGGRLPPKSSIREVQINVNPFSAEYDQLGEGRIEIFTNTGQSQYHGQAGIMANESAFNSRNPFAITEPDYDSLIYGGSFGGPLGKSGSFFASALRRNLGDISVVNATVLGPELNPLPSYGSISSPRTLTEFDPGMDFKLGKNNTLSARYQYFQNDATNQGVGGLNLASQAYDARTTEQTVQFRDVQVVGDHVVNETRFQYIRNDIGEAAQNSGANISVPGAFSTGGNGIGDITETANRYELQNHTSIDLGKHFLKFGGRVREATINAYATSGFNGEFIFPSLNAYQITQSGLAQGESGSQIRADGGGASQFTLTAGLPSTAISLFDAGVYIQDDWRLLRNVMLSSGLRFETQTDIHDHADFAPRVAIAWGLGRTKSGDPATVLRAGFGVFYERFGDAYVLEAARLNGVTQEQYIATNPDFYPTVPEAGSADLSGATTTSTIHNISPQLHAPYTLQSAVTLERELGRSANLSISYLNTRGGDQFISRNINAPFPGLYDPSDPSYGRPDPNEGNIYQYDSIGIYRQNEVIVRVNARVARRLFIIANYALDYANSDTAGADTFPSNQYNIRADYGRASTDIRNRLFVIGSVMLPRGFRLSPFVEASSGAPYNITLSEDLNGSSILNQRPAFASSLSDPQNVVVTQFGPLDTDPVPGETLVPINYANGPGSFTLNVRLAKAFRFGTRREIGGRARAQAVSARQSAARHRVPGPYTLMMSVIARNLFNNVNLGPPVGILNPPPALSPLFGKSVGIVGEGGVSAAANRTVYLQASLSF